MDYDVIIMGGGIVGCAAAYELCKYNLNVAVIEKNFDVAEDVALLNSSLISDGKDLDNEKIFKRTVESRNYLENLSSELEFFYEKVLYIVHFLKSDGCSLKQSFLHLCINELVHQFANRLLVVFG